MAMIWDQQQYLFKINKDCKKILYICYYSDSTGVCHSSGFFLQIGQGGRVNCKKERFYLNMNSVQLNYFRKLTMAAIIKPAAKTKTVCENCCRYQPRIKPTTPKIVMMICEYHSACPWPSKS